MKGHTGGGLTLGTGFPFETSTKQKPQQGLDSNGVLWSDSIHAQGSKTCACRRPSRSEINDYRDIQYNRSDRIARVRPGINGSLYRRVTFEFLPRINYFKRTFNPSPLFGNYKQRHAQFESIKTSYYEEMTTSFFLSNKLKKYKWIAVKSLNNDYHTRMLQLRET